MCVYQVSGSSDKNTTELEGEGVGFEGKNNVEFDRPAIIRRRDEISRKKVLFEWCA